MRDARRPFDIRPTVGIAIFCVALASGLIIASDRSTAEPVGGESRLVTGGGSATTAQAGRSLGEPSANEGDARPASAGDVPAAPVAGAGTFPTDSAAADADDGSDAVDGSDAIDGSDAVDLALSTEPVESATSLPSTASAAAEPEQAASSPTSSSTTTSRPTSTTPTTPTPTTTSPTSSRQAPPTTNTATTISPNTNAPTSSIVTTRAPDPNARWTIAQVISGTISAGDGSNPNEEAPMGRHDAPLYLPQSWNWAQGPTRNAAWGTLGTGSSRFAEWRCAVIPESGHVPPVDFRVNVRAGAYHQFVNGQWQKAFDVDLISTNNGGYLGQAGRVNQDPFSSGGHGRIEWRRESDGSFSAPWNSASLMMHFWAGKRQAPAAGQTAEFLSAEVRLQQPDGRTVDLSRVRVLFQCGIDYYNTTGGQGTKVPGPGIGTYHRASSQWKPTLWVTLPRSEPAASAEDFRQWLTQNPPPGVRP